MRTAWRLKAEAWLDCSTNAIVTAFMLGMGGDCCSVRGVLGANGRSPEPLMDLQALFAQDIKGHGLRVDSPHWGAALPGARSGVPQVKKRFIKQWSVTLGPSPEAAAETPRLPPILPTACRLGLTLERLCLILALASGEC